MDMTTPPTVEHTWLQRLVGEWTSECEMGGQTIRGTETVRAIGPYWIQAVGHSGMPGGGEAEMVLTLGYDPTQNRYQGTWIGSMMPFMFVYDITRDGDVLTMAVEGPAMEGPGTAQFRDIIEWKSDDVREFSGWIQGADGEWSRLMKATFRRA